MDTLRVHFIRNGSEVRGPLATEHLRELAEVGIAIPETESGASAAGLWTGRAEHAVAAEVWPRRRMLEFKAAEFSAVNEAVRPLEACEMIAHALRPAEALRGQEVLVRPTVLRGTRDGEPPNEVQRMVQEVGRKVAENAPPIMLPPPPVVSFPRWPWFAVAAVLGSGGFPSFPFFYNAPYDGMTVAILSGWVALFNGGLLALMVFDRGLSQTVRRNKGKMDALK